MEDLVRDYVVVIAEQATINSLRFERGHTYTVPEPILQTLLGLNVVKSVTPVEGATPIPVEDPTPAQPSTEEEPR